MEVIIFTNAGSTFMFKACRRIRETKEGLKFTYTGVSTGETRDAVFLRENMAGYAIMDPANGETEGVNDSCGFKNCVANHSEVDKYGGPDENASWRGSKNTIAPNPDACEEETPASR